MRSARGAETAALTAVVVHSWTAIGHDAKIEASRARGRAVRLSDGRRGEEGRSIAVAGQSVLPTVAQLSERTAWSHFAGGESRIAGSGSFRTMAAGGLRSSCGRSSEILKLSAGELWDFFWRVPSLPSELPTVARLVRAFRWRQAEARLRKHAWHTVPSVSILTISSKSYQDSQ